MNLLTWHLSSSLNRTSVRSISTAYTPEDASSQNSGLLHDMFDRVPEPSYLIWMQMHQCCCISWSWHFLLCKSNQTFSSLCPQSTTNFLQHLLSSSAYVFCMISFCLKWNMVLKTFLHSHKLFSCMEMTYQENSVCILHHVLQQPYLVYTSHKSLLGYCRWVTKTLPSLQQDVWGWASKYAWCKVLVTNWKVTRKWSHLK